MKPYTCWECGAGMYEDDECCEICGTLVEPQQDEPMDDSGELDKR